MQKRTLAIRKHRKIATVGVSQILVLIVCLHNTIVEACFYKTKFFVTRLQNNKFS